MGRKYSDDSYGAHREFCLGGKITTLDGTYQSATNLARYTFMHPVKILDWNLQVIAGGTDLGADFEFILGKSAAGTGAVTGFGTSDLGGGTGTHADASVIDCAATETSFSAGDDVVLQIIGTVGHAWISQANLETMEAFEQSDS